MNFQSFGVGYMRKKIYIFLIVFALFALALAPIFKGVGEENILKSETPEAEEVFGVNSANYALLSEDGQLIFAHGENIRRGMASTTKIMTCLVAIENGNLEKETEIPKEACDIEGSSVYLEAGERLTLRELLYCLMLESGNDAAEAIAISVGGSEENFVKMMNARASELGLKDTRFANPHGLSSKEHYTTAYELAKITLEAYKYPIFKEIVSTKIKKVRYRGIENGRTLINHNRLLFSDGSCVGVKTGYTQADGKCLASAFEKDGTLIVCASLGDSFPKGTHEALKEKAFSGYERIKIFGAGELKKTVKVEGGKKEFIELSNANDVYIFIPKGKNFEVVFDDTILNAPIKEFDVCGIAKVICEGRMVDIIFLEADEDDGVLKKSFFEKLFGK